MPILDDGSSGRAVESVLRDERRVGRVQSVSDPAARWEQDSRQHLPEKFGSAIEAIEQYGFIILLLALFTGVFGVVFGVVIPIAWNILFIGIS
jgi:hypothetical protein